MKAISIGRDQGCDIVIQDNTDVISRRHAILNITSTGKMAIVDQSRNGTYVNGIRISPNVPVPVTKKDIISFAHVTKLDWNAIPQTGGYMRYGIIALVAALIIGCGIFAYLHFTEDTPANQPQPVVPVDTVKKDTAKNETEKPAEENVDADKNGEKKDTIKNKKKTPKKNSTKQNKEKEKPQTSGDSIPNNRPIG